MYRRSYQLIVALLILSVMSGYFRSHSSWSGRTGIRWIYKEYSFLNSWWQSSLIVFTIWLLLFGIQSQVQKRSKSAVAKIVHIVAIALAIIGLCFTYNDFRETLSHRILGERFHIGAYLFWIGWIMISIYLWTGSRKCVVDNNTDEESGLV